MNKDKVLSILVTAAKVFGFIATVGAFPVIAPHVGLAIVAGASTLKEVVKFAGDIVDNGKKDDSFKP